MYVAIDVGGTTARVAAFTDRDEPTITKRQNFPVVNNFDRDLSTIENAIRSVIGDKPAGIGVSVAGRLDRKYQSLLKSPNLKAWVGQPLYNRLRRVFSCPVVVRNDAFSAAYGEAYERRGRSQDFWFIIWGTGIGGSLVRYQPKLTVTAAESGHRIIDVGGPVCACGKRGCWEALAGGTSITKYYGKSPASLSDREWQKVERGFARGLAVTLKHQPTSLVVLGGGIATKQIKRIPTIAAEVRRLLGGKNQPTIEISILGRDAGLYGALALLCMEQS